MSIKVIGIDLGGLEKNISGLCVLGLGIPHKNDAILLKLHSVHKDEEIMENIKQEKPAVIGIDAPLSFHGEPFRDCDAEIRKYYRILPLTLQGMRKLTERGIKLRRMIKERINSEVIEVYPYATTKILDIKGEKSLKSYVKYEYQWKHEYEHIKIKNKHEYDAIICAITAKFFYEGKYFAFGKEDRIIVPLKE